MEFDLQKGAIENGQYRNSEKTMQENSLKIPNG